MEKRMDAIISAFQQKVKKLFEQYELTEIGLLLETQKAWDKIEALPYGTMQEKHLATKKKVRLCKISKYLAGIYYVM